MAQIDVVEEIIGKYEHAAGKHGDRLKEMAIWDDMYYAAHYSSQMGWEDAEEGEERYISPTPTNVVDMSLAILMTSPMKIRARPERETKTTQEKSSQVEMWLKGSVYANVLRQSENPIRATAFDSLQRGWGVVFSGWDPDLEDAEKFPGILRHIDPMHFFWLRGGNRPHRLQCYTFTRNAGEVADEYRNAKGNKKPLYKFVVDDDGEKKRIKVEEDGDVERYIDLWWFQGNKVFNAVVWGATLIKKPIEMPYYDDLPYTVIPCISTTSNKLHEQSHPVIFALRHAVTQSERMTNYMLRSIELHGDPLMAQMEGIEVDKKPGSIITIPAEFGNWQSGVGFVNPPGVPGDILRALSLFSKHEQESSYGDVSYGNVNPESGVAGQMMTGNDRVRLDTPRASLELGFTRALQKLLSTCSLAGEGNKMYVFEQGKQSVTLTGEQLKGWRVDCTLDIELPNDFIRDVNLAATIRQAGLPYPDRYIQENLLRIEQPEEAKKQMIREFVDAMPEVRQAAIEIALEEIKPELRERIEAARQKAEKPQAPEMAPGAIPPGNMGPGPVPEPPAPAGMGGPGGFPVPDGVLPIDVIPQER